MKKRYIRSNIPKIKTLQLSGNINKFSTFHKNKLKNLRYKEQPTSVSSIVNHSVNSIHIDDDVIMHGNNDNSLDDDIIVHNDNTEDYDVDDYYHYDEEQSTTAVSEDYIDDNDHDNNNDDNDYDDLLHQYDDVQHQDVFHSIRKSFRYDIYKIVDKSNEHQFYIGSTLHFMSRKSKHKKNVNNTHSKSYNCLLYQYIRRNGGWKKFEMLSIENGNSYSKQEVKSIEQNYIDKYKPTLNKNRATTIKFNLLTHLEKSKNSNMTSPAKTTSSLTSMRSLNIPRSKEEITTYYIDQQIQEIKKYGNLKFGSNKLSTISPTKTRSRAPNLIITINEDIAKELKNAKQLEYATQCPQSKKAFIQQNLQFLSWILQNHCTKRNFALLKLMNYLVAKTYLLDDWHNLLKEKKMSNDTIRGRFNNISLLIQLFNSCLTHKNNTSVENCIKHCRIITRKCEYDLNEELSKISTIDYINKGLLPKNLKSDLLQMWKLLLPLMYNIIQLSKTITIKKKLYSLLLRCILFGFWAENANGRMRAVISMTMEQYKHMCNKNYNSSSQTKSLKQHGRQLISLCSNSDLLVYLKMYVDFVRPQIENNIMDKDYVFLK
jgi:hypothetical protein